MGLQRASFQQGKSLEQYYEALKASTDSGTASVGCTMLDLLPLLKDVCNDRDIWALTSHHCLWLLPGDERTSPWLVSVFGCGGRFQIEYRLPATTAPWSNAMVSGQAVDAADAARMVRTAIDRSDGWPCP
jgi:hypothetical protein